MVTLCVPEWNESSNKFKNNNHHRHLSPLYRSGLNETETGSSQEMIGKEKNMFDENLENSRNYINMFS